MTETIGAPRSVAVPSYSSVHAQVVDLPGAAQDSSEEHTLAIGNFLLTWSNDRPLSLASSTSSLAGRAGIALVEVFTATAQRARSSQAYFRSAVGERLRVANIASGTDGQDLGAQQLVVQQRDRVSGLETSTTLTVAHGTDTIRVQTRISNTSTGPITLTAASSATFGFGQDPQDINELTLMCARGEWLAENRWLPTPLGELLPPVNLGFHAQDGRGHHGITSHGAWSSGEYLPVGTLVSHESAHEGAAIAWQLETSAGWHVDLCQAMSGGVISLLGPTDNEHQFAHRLEPGASFETVAAVLAVSREGLDGVAGELTKYRRWLRRNYAEEPLPVVYNDFMNTLMGQPTTEALLPLIDQAAAAGAEVFCIDAGWFASPEIGDWWSTVGDWEEAEDRFPEGGLRRLTKKISDLGMRVGLWLEPEVVGTQSPTAHTLPNEAFFTRFGERVQEQDRYHLDFRHPAAREHLNNVVDFLVAEHEVTYLKLDYNINPGVGTEWQATSAGDGLLGHTRAYHAWLEEVQERHPGLQLENCSSGAQRADYAILSATHIQSTSDQQDLLLYPPVAVAAPLSILPEQCGNWAYPAQNMSPEEIAFTLVSGLSGRFYLAGFLDELDPTQLEAVHEAVALHKDLRGVLATATPFWPMGLPGWQDDIMCLGLRNSDTTLLFIWDRHDQASSLTIPGYFGSISKSFPAHSWQIDQDSTGLRVQTPQGPTARMVRFANDSNENGSQND